MVTMQPAMIGAQASAPSGLRECVQERTESADCCPACGQRGALVPLGMRYDYPHRWRPWSVCATPLALCGWCDALVVGAASRPGLMDSQPRDMAGI